MLDTIALFTSIFTFMMGCTVEHQRLSMNNITRAICQLANVSSPQLRLMTTVSYTPPSPTCPALFWPRYQPQHQTISFFPTNRFLHLHRHVLAHANCAIMLRLYLFTRLVSLCRLLWREEENFIFIQGNQDYSWLYVGIGIKIICMSHYVCTRIE